MTWVENRTWGPVIEWDDTNSALTMTYSPATFRLRLYSDGRIVGESEVPTPDMARAAVEFFDHAPGSSAHKRLVNAASLADFEAKAARFPVAYSVLYSTETNTYDVTLFVESGPEWSKRRERVPAHLLRFAKAEMAADYFRAVTALPHQRAEQDDLIERIAQAVENDPTSEVPYEMERAYANAVEIIRSFKTGGSRS